MFLPYYVRERPSGANEMMDEVIAAMKTMSERKTGAMIGLMRDRAALEAMVLGVRLDAKVTTELLLAVFNKSGPLHDGAAIIDDDVLRYAGCFFPLSEREQSIRFLGSRHHAGLGMTERADIVVLVVSEETGAMSVCHNGRIAYNLTGEQVGKLAGLLLSPDPARATVLPAAMPE